MALYCVSRKSQTYHDRRGSYAHKVIPFRKKSRRYHPPKQRPLRKVRREVLARDNYTCQCCELSIDIVLELSIHHIIHVDERGTHDSDNLMTACMDCHYLIHNDLSDLIPSGKDPRLVEFKHLFKYPLAS
jgi:5-methylcytosine-specific restriction endonuclease McrA